MYYKKILLSLLFFSFSFLILSAQQTTIFTEANLLYKRGLDYFEKGVYGLAQKEFQDVIELMRPVNESEYDLLRKKAQLYHAKSAVLLNQPEGEKLVLDFAREYAPDPLANEAILEMGNYYFNNKDYEKAQELYSQLNTFELNKKQRTEIQFRKGYAYFVRKKFNQAQSSFKSIKENTESIYYYPSNYYDGMCSFFRNKYDDAIKSFKRVEGSKKYKPLVPSYIAQIYFAQGEYNKLIDYAVPKLKNSKVRKKKDIEALLGQAYFEREDYYNALPYLENYASSSSKMRKEDFYQLGLTQYQNDKFKKAAENLKQLNKENNKLGQNAMYLLADCYLKGGKKASARNAFKKASSMDFDTDIKKEALYNFAKLSYELKYDREAVTALQKIPSESKYYSEAQTMLSNIFLNTRDYEKAMEIIEKLPNKTNKIRETYQKVAYFRGVQLYKEKRYDAANPFFHKSLRDPLDTRTEALAYYWLGEIAHANKDYDKSIRQHNKFLSVAKTLNRLPDEASEFTSNYTQGYNYLKQKDFGSALGYFQETIAGIKQNDMYISDPYVKKKILGDATLRAGDCLFKANQYDKAVKYYDEAVNKKYTGYLYALYQKAMIEGLRGKTTNKIIALENIVEDHPTSEFADNALFQLAITYQEIGKYDKAIQPLKTLVRDYKNKSELVNPALLKLGLITYNQGNLQTAISYYKQVFSNNPEASEANEALTALEEIYVDDLGKPDDYLAFLETVPGYNLGNDEKETINFKAAETQFENANYERAIDAYNNYLRKYPNGRNSLLAYYRRGESHSVLKNYSKALKDYEVVIGKGNSNYYAKALNKAAIITYNHELDFSKAYTLYTKLISIASNDDEKFEAQLGALRSAYRTNNMTAVSELANAVASNTRATKEQRSTARFFLGKIAMDSKDFDAALAAFNEVTKLSDNEQTAEARYSIAYIYYAKRELELAEQLCLNAYKESSNYPYWVAKSVILLADILAERGDLFNAQAALEGLIENYDEDQELVNIAKAKLQKLKLQEAEGSRLSRETTDDDDLEMDEGQK